MRTFLIVSLFCLISEAAQAADKNLKLPKPIVTLQQMQVRQGECESNWEEMAQSVGVIRSVIDQDMTLYFVPCAEWAHNFAWATYLTIKESSHPDGFLTKSIRYVDYSAYKGLVAQDFAYNIQWNEDTKTLMARFFLNGKDICGSQSEFKWDSGQQTLILSRLIKQDICVGNGGPWISMMQPKPLKYFENGEFTNLKEVFEKAKTLGKPKE